MSYHILSEEDLLNPSMLRWTNSNLDWWCRSLSDALMTTQINAENGLHFSFKLQDDHLIATYDVPGCEPSSISVEVEKATLTVAAHRLGKKMVRSHVINDDYDLNLATATLKHGELVIKVPRRALSQKRSITVDIG